MGIIFVGGGISAQTGGGGGGGGAAPITFLFRDDFTTPRAAPMATPRSAEPGPGTPNVSTALSTAAGSLVLSGGNFTWNTRATMPQVRATGRALLGKIISTSSGYKQFGWAINDAIECYAGGFYIFAGNAIKIWENTAEINTGLSIVQGIEYQVACILRSAGSFVLIKGGVFAQWTLLWPGVFSSATPVYGGPRIYDGSATLDTVRMLDLAAPFNSDFGLATQRLSGSQSAGQTFVHEANCVIEFTVTTVATDIIMFFRIQDASNHWYVQINVAGNMYIYEKVAGVDTLRGSSAAGVANGHRIVIVADGTFIGIYSNNLSRIFYSNANNFATATSGELNSLGVGGAVSDLISWPRQLPAAAAALLDEALAG